MSTTIQAFIAVLSCTAAACVSIESNPLLSETSSSEETGVETTTSNTSTTLDSSSTTGTPDSSSTESESSSGTMGSCPASEVCAPGIAQDWDGPAILRAATDASVAECDGAFDQKEAVLYADFDAPPASCTCTCEAVGEPSCETFAWVRTDVACGPSVGIWEVGESCNAAVTQTAGGSLGAYPVEVVGVECAPVVTESISPARFDTEYALCRTHEAPSCDEGVCVPDPSNSGQVCIWREGDFACPDSWSSSRHLLYRGFIDERRCDECTCDDFDGECTGFTVHLFGTNACNEAPVGALTPDGDCTEIGNQGVTAATLDGVGVPQVDCSGNALGGGPIGSAGPDAPVTVCCQAS